MSDQLSGTQLTAKWPVRTGQKITITLNDELAGLLNEIRELQKRYFESDHCYAPETEIQTAVKFDLQRQIKALKETLADKEKGQP